MIQPAPGTLLIADPFLKDPNFLRTVVLLCEHQQEGSLGFILNKKFKYNLSNLITELADYPLPVYHGGPVQPDTIHFLHQYNTLIPDAVEIGSNIYWGGNFETVTSLIKTNSIDTKKIKFFIGYSGWSQGQLKDEIDQKSWLTVSATRNIVFQTGYDDIWKKSLKHLGGDYEMMVNFPIDPRLN